MDKVKLEEKFVITRNSIKPNSPDYNKEVQSALERTKYLFPQLCLLADPVLTFIRENPVGYSNSKPIESTSFDLQQYRFELYPKDESAAFHLLKTINSQITRPLILDFLLHVNYLHDTFPSLLPSLNELYFHIYTENKIPIIQLALISHLFSISPVNVYELSRIYEPQKINHPGKVVSCILTTDNRILPLSLGDPLFTVSEDSIYLYFFKHEYVFTPSKKTLQYRKKSKPEKVSTKDFFAFLINADTEPLESIGIINDQLYFAQKINNRRIRISTFKTGVLGDNIQRKESIVVLKSDYFKCTFFKKNLMISLTNGKKYLYDVARSIMIKNPQLFNFYYDFSDISIYNSSDDQFILVNQDGENLLFEIIKHQTARSSFMQILPPFYGTTTDEIISRLSFELLNLSTDVLSSLMNHGFYEDESDDDKSKVVSHPLVHIDYALDLADIILKNSQNHDQKLCDFCLIATTRFIIVNVYQLYATNNYLAKYQMNRITNLFSSMKITFPHYDTLFSMISVINHGIYTNNFISKVLHPFFPLLEDNITNNLMQSPSFILFINKESIESLSLKDKMKMIQSQATLLIDMYTEINSDEALIPFMTVFFDVLQESLISKSVSNAAVCAYFASILPFLSTMNNTPQLSMFVLKQLFKCIEQLSKRIIPIISSTDKLFSGDANLDHFKETKTLSITFNINVCENWYLNSISLDDIFGIENYQLNDEHLYHQHEIFNKRFHFLENWTKEDFLIYLLPNAIINAIEICYKSIEITQAELENDRLIHYGIHNDISKEDSSTKKTDRSPKRQSSYTLFTIKDEKDFLNELNNDSILIKRLRKEVKCVIKEKEEVELLIFKALLYQARIVNYAHAVTEQSSINPLVVSAWKLAIKIRSNLKFSRQRSQDKRASHANLNERYSDYCQSIQEKCECLLKQNITDAPVNTLEWMQMNYSFIASNLLLIELSTLSKIAKVRKDIKEFSLTALKKILQMKLPPSFQRSLISYLFKNETLAEAIKNDEEIIQILLMSPDPFNRLSVFNCITIDRYPEIADYLINENEENNQTILTFCDIFAEKEDNVNIDSLLGIIGHCSYEYVPGIPTYKFYEYIDIVQEKETTLNIISRIQNCDNETIGAMTILSKKKCFDANESKLIAERLSLLNIQNDSHPRNLLLLNLISYLLCLISNKSPEIDQMITRRFDINVFNNFFTKTSNFKSFYPDEPYLLLDVLREINENKLQNYHQETPRFIQLKGNSVSENQPNKIRIFPQEFSYYVFSKPIDDTENITFKIEQKGICGSDLYYIILAMVNMYNNSAITNLYQADTNICIYQDFGSNLFTFGFDFDEVPNQGIQGPVIPFILAIGCDIEITYSYNTSLSSSFVPPQNIVPFSQIEYTIIPKAIVGSRVRIENVGDGIVIETNENNDDVVVSIYSKNQSLALINSSSNAFKELKDHLFLTLLRSLTIIDGYSNSSFIENYFVSLVSEISQQYYRLYLALQGNSEMLFRIINIESSFNFVLAAFNDIFVKFINNNLSTVFAVVSTSAIPACINLLDHDIFDNQLHIILAFALSQSGIEGDANLNLVLSKMRYKKVEYHVSQIEHFVSLLIKVVSSQNLLVILIQNQVFMTYLIDLCSFLFENAFSELEQIVLKYPVLLSRLIYYACFTPTQLTKFVVFSYYHYQLNDIFLINQNSKFSLNIPCINLNTNETLDVGKDYCFNEDTKMRPIRPDISIEELQRDIDELNKDSIEKIDLLIWAYTQHDKLYIDNEFNLKQSIIYCLICIADILKLFEPIPAFLPLPEKLKTVQAKLQVVDYYEMHLTLSRMQNKRQLLFDQFCSQVANDIVRLRNKSPFNVSFVAESGSDAGGLKREAITLIYKELIDPNNKIFQFDQNGFLVPSTNCSSRRLTYAGAFIATCFISNNPHDFHLAPRIWELFTLFETKAYNDSEMALKLGFNTVVPADTLDICVPSDIRRLTCGDGFTKAKFIDKCQFYNPEIRNIFIAAIADFTIQELQQLLSFITGTQTLPFDPNFQIRISFLSFNSTGVNEKNWPLPVAHTCFKSVEIAQFTNPTILADKLRLAMYAIMISDGEPNYENLSL